MEISNSLGISNQGLNNQGLTKVNALKQAQTSEVERFENALMAHGYQDGLTLADKVGHDVSNKVSTVFSDLVSKDITNNANANAGIETCFIMIKPERRHR